jgi:hypothetical protein
MASKSSKVGLIVAIVVGSAVAAILANSKSFFSPRWKTFTSEAGAFSILMPGTPATSQSETPAGGSNLRVDMVSAEGKNGSAFLCSYIDYPSTPDSGTAFDAIRDGSIRAVRGRLVSERTINVGDNPAREFQAELPSHDVIDERYVLAGQRLFMLVVVSKAGARNANDIDKFFTSLQFTAKKL